MATRAQARNAGGTPSSTATLMNRYGMPHSAETAAKAPQARALMPPSMAYGARRPSLAAARRSARATQVADLRGEERRVARGAEPPADGHGARHDEVVEAALGRT